MAAAARQTVTLAAISDGHGRFAVLAIDHRDSLRVFLSPGDPAAVSAAEITLLKIQLVRALASESTGVMLEPEYSIPQVGDAGALPSGVGFIAALESQGYQENPGSVPTTILDGWSVEAAAASGASCAKLLLPYHPDRPSAAAQEAVAQEVLDDCRRVGIPLVLEPLFHGLADPTDRPRVVLATAARFANINPDLLKLPFPVDTVADPDEDHWFAACRTISEVAHMPWVLLSGGGTFEKFAAELAVARRAGCAGFMVGRALWGEAARSAPTERQPILDGLIRRRLRLLREIVEAEG
jgi:sulfofructosephosphate aldolase